MIQFLSQDDGGEEVLSQGLEPSYSGSEYSVLKLQQHLRFDEDITLLCQLISVFSKLECGKFFFFFGTNVFQENFILVEKQMNLFWLSCMLALHQALSCDVSAFVCVAGVAGYDCNVTNQFLCNGSREIKEV